MSEGNHLYSSVATRSDAEQLYVASGPACLFELRVFEVVPKVTGTVSQADQLTIT